MRWLRTLLCWLVIVLVAPLASLTAQDEPPAPKPKSVDELVKQLNAFDSDTTDRRNAAFELAQLGPKARDALPDLIAKMKDSGEENLVRYWCAYAIGAMGAEAKDAVLDLGDVAQDIRVRSDLIRIRAIIALEQIGSDAKDAVPALKAVLQGRGNKTLQYYAIISLRKIDPDEAQNFNP
jgi:hypothetical protein